MNNNFFNFYFKIQTSEFEKKNQVFFDEMKNNSTKIIHQKNPFKKIVNRKKILKEN